MSRIAIGLALILACVPARAQAQRPSESVALNRSLWGTIVPIGLGLAMAASAGNEGPNGSGEIGALGFMAFTGGLVVGPSLGYFYAGERGRAWRGLGLRILGYGALFGAVAASWDCYGDECRAGAALAVVGSAMTLGSAIYDIASVRGAVRRRNEAAEGRSVRVAPMYSSRRHTAGVSVRLTF